jgi:NADH-quinone oxidoreductase subunit M
MNVIPLSTAWLEAAIGLSLVGALAVRRCRDATAAWRVGVVFAGGVLVAASLSFLGFHLGRWHGIGDETGLLETWLGVKLLGLDELSAPMVPLVALIHFLTLLATGRTKMRRFSSSFSLASLAIRLAIFGCVELSLLVALLVACVVPPYFELRQRRQSARLYLLHVTAFVALLMLGWSNVDPSLARREQSPWATLPLLLAILIRCGTFPAHGWVTDWFARASFGNALLFVMPLVGVHAAVRLVLPIAPDWALWCISMLSMATAVLAAGMALVQDDARRFFAFLFLSHASLVLVGLELHTTTSLTGALSLWIAVSLALTGFGLTLRALEARYGRLSLRAYCGLYGQSPALAACFLVTGLASVGFPGTLGFIAAEMLVDGAVSASPVIGLAVVLASALNGIAIVRAYFALFLGTRHISSIPLGIGWRERLAFWTLAAAIFGGGLTPQPGVESRHRAAVAILEARQRNLGDVEPPPVRFDDHETER